MNNLNRRYFDVRLAVLRREGVYFEQLAPDVRVINLDCRTLASLPRIVATIRRERPDVVLSTISNLNIVVGLCRVFFPRRRIRFIVRESSHPSGRKMYYRHIFNSDFFHTIAYRLCDTVICQSEDMLADVHKTYRMPVRKLLKIHNPVDIAALQQEAFKEVPVLCPERINLLAVGRLHPEKGFDLLLSAMSMTTNRRLHLHILGEGGERQRLCDQVMRLGIQDRVTFHGFQRNPYPYFAHADAFVLSSRYEGFPNALVEAIALGCPAIVARCKGGIDEIVEDGVNGIIVPGNDPGALAQAMDSLEYLLLPAQGVAASASRFSLSRIIPKYEALLLGRQEAQEPVLVDAS